MQVECNKNELVHGETLLYYNNNYVHKSVILLFIAIISITVMPMAMGSKEAVTSVSVTQYH